MWTLSQQNSVLETDVLEDCSDGLFFFKQQKPALVEFFVFVFKGVSLF